MGVSVTENVTPILRTIFTIIHDEVVNALTMLGEECVNNIRNRPAEMSWIDQTGNLRSSIGYAVFDDGKKIAESVFQQVKQGSEGVSEGRKMVNELASLYSDTFALVVLAGMDYADYVERKDNKYVLASEELRAKKVINSVIKIAIKRANTKINKLIS